MALKDHVKTVENWREHLDRDGKHPKRGRFLMLTREMLNSRAFSALSKGGIIVVLAMLNKLDWEPKGTKDAKGVKVGTSRLKNGGEFILTGNELRARGLKSEKTIAEAKRQAWELGFCDTVVVGTVNNAYRGRLSYRWREYPNGDYKPRAGDQPPGMRKYYGFDSETNPSKKKSPAEDTRREPIKNTRRRRERLRVKTARNGENLSLFSPVESTRI